MRIASLPLLILTVVLAAGEGGPPPPLAVPGPDGRIALPKSAPDVASATIVSGVLPPSGRWTIHLAFATWCAPCHEVTAVLKRVLVGRDDIMVIGVADEPKEKLAPFVAEQGITWPVVTGSKAYASVAIAGGIPACVVVSPDGKPVWVGHPLAFLGIMDLVVAGQFDPANMAAIDPLLADVAGLIQASKDKGRQPDWNAVDEKAAAILAILPVHPKAIAARLAVARSRGDHGGYDRVLAAIPGDMVTVPLMDALVPPLFDDGLAWESPYHALRLADAGVARRPADRGLRMHLVGILIRVGRFRDAMQVAQELPNDIRSVFHGCITGRIRASNLPLASVPKPTPKPAAAIQPDPVQPKVGP